jgi:hypothetical protein
MMIWIGLKWFRREALSCASVGMNLQGTGW